jgi:hypothetical protein
MSDFATMRTRIADELANDGDITTAQINYAIQDTIKQYERRPWWFNQKTATFPAIASREYYGSADLADIPNIVQIIAATVTVSSMKAPLKALDYVAIDDEQDGSVVGEPRVFASFKNEIRLFPIPNDAYTITLSYIYRLTALSADADTNAWMVEAEELIRSGAKRRIALNYLESEEVAARFAVMEREAFTELQGENRRRWPNTILRIPAMLPPNDFNMTRGW